MAATESFAGVLAIMRTGAIGVPSEHCTVEATRRRFSQDHLM